MSLGGVRWLCSTVGSYAGISDFADVQFSCVVASFPKRDPLLEAGGKGSVFAECAKKKAQLKKSGATYSKTKNETVVERCNEKRGHKKAWTWKDVVRDFVFVHQGCVPLSLSRIRGPPRSGVCLSARLQLGGKYCHPFKILPTLRLLIIASRAVNTVINGFGI